MVGCFCLKRSRFMQHCSNAGTGKTAHDKDGSDDGEGEGWGGDDDLDLGDVEVEESTPANASGYVVCDEVHDLVA